MIKKKLEAELSRLVVKALGLEGLEVALEHPANEAFGDFTANTALKAAKVLRQSPPEVAKNLVEVFSRSEELKALGVEKVESAGPGFINFYLSPAVLIGEVSQILSKGGNYGSSNLLNGQKIMIEFADPNPFKEFHIGHLRNISFGESLVRLHRALGADVRPVNYQGDVGLQVAKSLWGLIKILKINPSTGSSGLTLSEAERVKNQILEMGALTLEERVKLLGMAYVEGSKAYDESPEAAGEMVAMNVSIYNQDQRQPELLDLWKTGRTWSLEYFEVIYKRVGTDFKRYYFESEVAGKGRQLVLDHIADGVFKKSEGAVIFDGDKFGLHTRVFIAKEGYATYEAKDLYLATLKHSEFPYDLSLILTGNEQAEYFKVVLTALSKVSPELSAKTRNITFGMVNLRGEKMTSRKGNVVTALSVLEQAKDQVKKLSNLSDLNDLEKDEIAEKVAVGAVKYSLLKSDAKNDIAFDLKESVALEGNSGPYLQYTYARAKSVLRKSQEASIKNQEKAPGDLDSSSMIHDSPLVAEELSLLHTLYKFPEVVESAASQYSPHLICNYLFDLAQKFNLFYNNVKILGDTSQKVSRVANAPRNDVILGTSNARTPESTAEFPLVLTEACAQIIKNGLDLLGIAAPERM